jgi:hypothetical protein
MPKNKVVASVDKYAIKDYQSIDLLKELHILTRDGKMNQDSRRKIKQVLHLVQFIEPIIQSVTTQKGSVQLIDFGSGKSYLGFMLYDLVAKLLSTPFNIIGIDVRVELVEYCRNLAHKLNFTQMAFYHLSAEESLLAPELPQNIDIVTALHACNTATDDAIKFALEKNVAHLILVPCCQAELASLFNKNKSESLKNSYFTALWKYPIHTREFGSHITNVLRCLYLESKGYDVTVTELVGWEHSLKNELIIANKMPHAGKMAKAQNQLKNLLDEFNLKTLAPRYEIFI